MQLLADPVEHSPVVRSDAAVIVGSGLLGKLVMTTIMYLAPLLGARQVDAPLWIAHLVVSTPMAALGVGLSLHLVVGFAYAWLFARSIEPRLTEHSLRNGLLFGAALWAFAQAIAVPSDRWRGRSDRDCSGTGPRCVVDAPGGGRRPWSAWPPI